MLLANDIESKSPAGPDKGHLATIFLSLPFGPAVDLMTGQTPDLAFIEGKGSAGRINRHNIDGMMVFFVVMTTKTRARYIEPWRKDSIAQLRVFIP